MFANYIDTAMVGSMGASATAAVAINQSIIELVNTFFFSFGIGLTAIVARSIGAGDAQRAKRVVGQGALIAVVMGSVMSLTMCLLSRHIPAWLGGQPDVLDNAATYLFLISSVLLFKSVSIIFTSVLRAVGENKIPLLINIATNLLHVLTSFFLIYPSRTVTLFGSTFDVWGADLGVAGAAISTGASTVLSCVLIVCVVVFKDSAVRLSDVRALAPDRDILRSIFAVSLPATGERIVTSVARIAQTLLVTSLGTVALAGHHLASTAESLCFMPPFGFSAAVTTLVGQSLGAQRIDLAETFTKLTAKLATALMTVASVFLFVFAVPLVTVFNKDPEVIAYGAACLRIVAFAEPFLALSLAYFGAFRGAGDTRTPFLVTLFSMWCLRIIPASIAIFVFGWGLNAVWIFMSVDMITKGVVGFVRFRGGRWKDTINFIPITAGADAQAPEGEADKAAECLD